MNSAVRKPVFTNPPANTPQTTPTIQTPTPVHPIGTPTPTHQPTQSPSTSTHGNPSYDFTPLNKTAMGSIDATPPITSPLSSSSAFKSTSTVDPTTNSNLPPSHLGSSIGSHAPNPISTSPLQPSYIQSPVQPLSTPVPPNLPNSQPPPLMTPSTVPASIETPTPNLPSSTASTTQSQVSPAQAFLEKLNLLNQEPNSVDLQPIALSLSQVEGIGPHTKGPLIFFFNFSNFF